MNRQELERIVTEFMDSFTTMTLACSVDDKPWAAAVYYARQGFDLVFFSSPDSLHSRNFSRNPSAAAAIHGDYRGWKEIKGLQLEGSVEPLTGATAKARALATYLKRYPFAKEFFVYPAAISPGVVLKMARMVLYRFRPDNILFMSNEAAFGTRWKLKLRKGKPVGEAVLA
jgi:uncharacterized protein YhbP (UPF0306 family)